MARNKLIQLRKGTRAELNASTANWTTGEIGFITDESKIIIADRFGPTGDQVFAEYGVGEASAVASDLSDHENETVGAHAASAISSTTTSNISSTNVQGAIDELSTEKLDVNAKAADVDPSGTSISGALALKANDADISTVGKTGAYSDLTGKPDLTVLNDVEIAANEAAFPATGSADRVYIAEDTGYMYRWNGSGYTQLSDQTAVWGQISGTLSNQTDLQNALNDKQDELAEGAFVDGDKNKLDGIEAGAEVNTVDSVDGNTGAVDLSTTYLGINAQADDVDPTGTAISGALSNKVDTSDSRLTDAREWTASTVSQAEAEAGTSTTRRAWTSLRVNQAINSWWGDTSIDGGSF